MLESRWNNQKLRSKKKNSTSRSLPNTTEVLEPKQRVSNSKKPSHEQEHADNDAVGEGASSNTPEEGNGAEVTSTPDMTWSRVDQNEPRTTNAQRGESSLKGKPLSGADSDEATSKRLPDRIHQAAMRKSRRTSTNPQPVVSTPAIAEPRRAGVPPPRPTSHLAASNILAHVWMESCGWDRQLCVQQSNQLMDLSSVTSFSNLIRLVESRYDKSDLLRVRHMVMESRCDVRIPRWYPISADDEYTVPLVIDDFSRAHRFCIMLGKPECVYNVVLIRGRADSVEWNGVEDAEGLRGDDELSSSLRAVSATLRSSGRYTDFSPLTRSTHRELLRLMRSNMEVPWPRG